MDTTYAESDKWVFAESEFRAIWQDRKRCGTGFAAIITPSPRPSIRYWRCYESEVTGWLAIYSLSQPAAARWNVLGEGYGVSYIPIFVVCAAAGVGRKSEVNARNSMAQSLLNSVEGHEHRT